MKSRIVMVVVGVTLLPLTAAAADELKPVIQVIDHKGLMREPSRGDVKKPTVITTAEELAKAFPEKEVAGRVAKAVDFGNQKVLFFAWSGSGRDSLAFNAEVVKGKTEVVVTYRAGATDDLVGHFSIVAVPRDATVKFADK